MSTQLDLTSYLADQADDGVKDSEGDFTISHQNARRKLARFSLPRESAWASKLVQAAVGWKTMKIQAAQSKTETQFFFHTERPAELPTEDQIVATLLSGNVNADSPIEHFCLALRAVVEQSGKSFILAINDGDMKPKPIYAGSYYGELTEAERLDERYDRGMGITLTIHHASELTLSSSLSEMLQPTDESIPIILELRAHAYTCPIPLELSGYRLDGFLDSPLFSSQYVPLLLSGVKELKHSPRFMGVPPKFEEKRLSFKSHPRRIRRSYGGSRDFSAVFILTARPLKTTDWRRRQSRLNWVRDGVIVQTNSFDLQTQTVGLHIYANADGLRSDLTGFQLIENDQKRLREQEILAAIAPRLREEREQTHLFFREDKDDESHEDDEIDKDAAFRSRVKTLIKGSTVGLLITLVNAPFGLFTTAGAMAKTYGSKLLKRNQKSALDKKQEAVSDSIRGDLRLLAQHLEHRVKSLKSGEQVTIGELELDINDEESVAAFMNAGLNDPSALVSRLEKLEQFDHVNAAKYHLLLGRGYRMMGDFKAGVYLKRAFDKKPSPELAEELAQFYEDEGKTKLAFLTRQKKYGMQSRG